MEESQTGDPWNKRSEIKVKILRRTPGVLNSVLRDDKFQKIVEPFYHQEGFDIYYKSIGASSVLRFEWIIGSCRSQSHL